MNAFQRVLSRVFASLFLATFLWIAYLILFVGKDYIALQPFVVLLGALFLIGVYFFLFSLGKQLAPKNPVRTEISLIAFVFLFYILLQILIATEFRTNFEQAWDFGVVARAAMEYTLYKLPPNDYFISFSNNTPLLFLLIGLFKFSAALGYYNFTTVGVIANIVMIDAAILVSYLAVRKITGTKTAAVVAMVALMLTLPLLAYISIYYTDTLTILYPILSLHLWQCAKENFAQQKKRKAWIQIAFCVLSAAVGTLLKVSVVIVLIAVVLDALLTLKLKKSAVIIGAALVFFSAVYLPLNAAIKNSALLPKDSEDVRIPWTHWIMMGLHGNGNYYDPDYKMTLSFPPEQRDAMVMAEIEQRIADYGLGGLLAHQAEKTAFVWADGDYYSHVKIMRDRVRSSSLDPYVIYDGERHVYYAYFCQFLQLALYTGFLISGVLIFKNKSYGRALLPYAVSIFGLFLFQNIWEARSRYLFNFIPVFAVLAICGFFRLYQILPGKIAAIRLNRIAKKSA